MLLRLIWNVSEGDTPSDHVYKVRELTADKLAILVALCQDPQSMDHRCVVVLFTAHGFYLHHFHQQGNQVRHGENGTAILPVAHQHHAVDEANHAPQDVRGTLLRAVLEGLNLAIEDIGSVLKDGVRWVYLRLIGMRAQKF